MSEYQYYEFLAIDRPLTGAEMARLRSLSSRAEISPTGFTNEYQWGDLKGDPHELMRRYFDAHVYLANWMRAVFMLRLPKSSIDRKTLDAFTAEPLFEIEASPNHWLLTWALNESEDGERFADIDGSGWMKRLAPLREELLRGDLRGLYIGWLAAVTRKEVTDETREPLSLPGLGTLTAAQQALAEFLEVDIDLLAGAAHGSASSSERPSEPALIEAWLDNLSPEETSGYLRQMLVGEGREAERTLRGRFAAWRQKSITTAGIRPRSVGELRQLAAQACKRRLQREAAAQQRAEAKRRKQRETHLASLATDFRKSWQAAGREAEKGTGRAYDTACRLLVDLAEAYRIHSTPRAFDKALRDFMTRHEHRPALLKRLARAGLRDDD